MAKRVSPLTSRLCRVPHVLWLNRARALAPYNDFHSSLSLFLFYPFCSFCLSLADLSPERCDDFFVCLLLLFCELPFDCYTSHWWEWNQFVHDSCTTGSFAHAICANLCKIEFASSFCPIIVNHIHIVTRSNASIAMCWLLTMYGDATKHDNRTEKWKWIL